MRSVQNTSFVYIYNPWSDSERIYTNNNEGLTMRAMEEAARTDTVIAGRVNLFRLRIPEEYYDLTTDPGCTVNLINNPALAREGARARKAMLKFMKQSDDPVMKLFVNRDKSPEVSQKLFYEVFPQAVKYDQIKSRYSRKIDEGNNYED
jgi:N-sulfoglucosamine sulfohydrolase